MEAKLTHVMYGGNDHTYWAEIDGQQVIIADLNGDGQITIDRSYDQSGVTTYAVGGGIMRVSDHPTTYDDDFVWDGSGYSSDEHLIEVARTLVSEFRANLPNEISLAAQWLENNGWESDTESTNDTLSDFCGAPEDNNLVRATDSAKDYLKDCDFDEDGTTDDELPRACNFFEDRTTYNEIAKVFDFDENGTADMAHILTSDRVLLMIQAEILPRPESCSCDTVDQTRRGVEAFLSPFDLFYCVGNAQD